MGHELLDLIGLDGDERLLPPCWPSSCSNTMLGTRPAFRSLAEMFLPEAARGTARMVSAYLGSGLGKSSRMGISGCMRAAADEWVK